LHELPHHTGNISTELLRDPKEALLEALNTLNPEGHSPHWLGTITADEPALQRTIQPKAWQEGSTYVMNAAKRRVLEQVEARAQSIANGDEYAVERAQQLGEQVGDRTRVLLQASCLSVDEGTRQHELPTHVIECMACRLP
jgi:hypothetical protein